MKIASLLLLCVPAAIALEHLAPGQRLWICLVSALAIVPCAGWMGKATGVLAARTSEGIGGLLAVYLILAIVFYFAPEGAP